MELSLQQFSESFSLNKLKYHNYALRFVRDGSVVEDLVNDSFINLWEARKNLDAATNIEAYFYTIIRNNCLNWLRNRSVQSKVKNKLYDTSYRLLQYDLASIEKYDPNLIFSNEIKVILQRELKKMPALTRNVFKDNRLNDLTYKEIAEKYNVSIWTVARRIQDVLRILRVSLKDYLPTVILVLSVILR